VLLCDIISGWLNLKKSLSVTIHIFNIWHLRLHHCRVVRSFVECSCKVTYVQTSSLIRIMGAAIFQMILCWTMYVHRIYSQYPSYRYSTLKSTPLIRIFFKSNILLIFIPCVSYLDFILKRLSFANLFLITLFTEIPVISLFWSSFNFSLLDTYIMPNKKKVAFYCLFKIIRK